MIRIKNCVLICFLFFGISQAKSQSFNESINYIKKKIITDCHYLSKDLDYNIKYEQVSYNQQNKILTVRRFSKKPSGTSTTHYSVKLTDLDVGRAKIQNLTYDGRVLHLLLRIPTIADIKLVGVKSVSKKYGENNYQDDYIEFYCEKENYNSLYKIKNAFAYVIKKLNSDSFRD